MLKDLNVEQARFIALLARTARMQRDEILGNVAEAVLGDVIPGKGEHNQTAELGLEPVAAEASPVAALREAITSLTPTARQELYMLMRVGQGHLAAKKWHRGLSEAKALGENTVTATMVEDADLHDHLAKGLYKLKLSAWPFPRKTLDVRKGIRRIIQVGLP
jgi:hypothetical protein